MAEALLPYIHHERQEPGSMLCAQHCLNTLLQRNIYDAAQLADIATQLDRLEAAELDADAYRASRADQGNLNMDDSGFFSVGVIESALQQWSLKMVRWRSAEMVPYHANPESTQLAFVLNFQSHWFTIRSFGSRKKYWFNLNSFFRQGPQFVGDFYLSELLRAAENERYSVFAIRLADESAGELTFYNSEADEIADTIPPNMSSGSSGAAGASGLHPDADHIDLTGDDDDAELQAALQASLAEAQPAAGPSSGSRASGSSSSRGADSPHTPAHRALPAASGGRRKKSRREQDDASSSGSVGRAAQRRAGPGPSRLGSTVNDSIDDDTEDSFQVIGTSRRSPFLHPALRGTVEGQDDDVDVVDLTTPDTGASRATNARAPPSGVIDVDALDDDEVYPEDDDSLDPFSIRGAPEASALIGPRADRVYDDEDAALQAALAASMGDTSAFDRLAEQHSASGGASIRATRTPPPEDVERIARMRAAARERERQGAQAADQSADASKAPAEKKEGEGDEDDEDDDDDAEEAPEEEVSPEEIRRRRLARFGA